MARLPQAERERVLREGLTDLELASAQRAAGRTPTLSVTLVTYPIGEYPKLRGMGWLNDGWVFYMSTRRVSKKASEILQDPRVSVLCIDHQRRRDHFIQIDGVAQEVTGPEFEAYQERRYQKEGENLRRATEGMTPADWFGFRIEPVRLRLLGYVNVRPWTEAPVVFTRDQLGLPPLEEPMLTRQPAYQ
jgi:pyridoxine/pyridoxamine 5'-phosphate oxidase